MKNKNIIGLIGGMGPHASAYFYRIMIEKSSEIYGAKNNDDFPEILIDSVPVPDFISDTKQLNEAKKMLLNRVRALNIFGCNVIAMVCNTGHILYADMVSNSKAPFISMIELVCKKAKEISMKRVGLLATETTIKSRIYNDYLREFGIELVYPNDSFIHRLDEIIRSVIAEGESKKFERELSRNTYKFIKSERLDGIILGCTELPLVFPKSKNEKIIDSLDVLANKLLNNFYEKKKFSDQKS